MLFYDENQRIRSCDIDKDRFDAICKPHLYRYIELFSQMRCKGGNGYYEYVKTLLESSNLSPKYYKPIDNYEVRVVEHIDDLFDTINKKENSDGLSRVICGPGWGMNESIDIEGRKFSWSSGRDYSFGQNSILSIHKSQGFDLNYAGVIFGKEVYFDEDDGCIKINKKELKDPMAKSDGDIVMRKNVLNMYLTLMTRGIKGTYVYACDHRLRKYLEMFLNEK